MKLTCQSEYALLALVSIARESDTAVISADRISKLQNIPLKFLEQILIVLRRAGLVKSSKGMRGGYRLAKQAEAISLAEVIRLFEGALAPTTSASKYFYETSPIEKEQKALNVFCEIRDFVARKLEATSIADICKVEVEHA
jgi:Rrf2 family protein